MENEVIKCSFCKRNVKDVNEQYFIQEETKDTVCYDCGYDPNKNVLKSSEIVPIKKKENENSDFKLAAFFHIFPFVREWRRHQIVDNKVTTKFMSEISLIEEAVILEAGLQQIKLAYINKKPIEAAYLLLDVLCHGIGWIEAHPSTMEPE